MTHPRYRPPLSQAHPTIRTPWKAIAAEARDAIKRDMVPGEPMLSLTQLAEMYDVHRSTARKAMRALAAEGLVELRPGKGYFVPPATPSAPRR